MYFTYLYLIVFSLLNCLKSLKASVSLVFSFCISSYWNSRCSSGAYLAQMVSLDVLGGIFASKSAK